MESIEYPLSTMKILYAICDNKSLALFNELAMNNGRAKELMIKLCISRKQLYSRISKLIRAGLIEPLGSEYSITIFGRVIYEMQIALRLVVENYSKIKNKQQLMKLDTDSLVKNFTTQIHSLRGIQDNRK